MKSFSYIGFITLLAISLSVGCGTTQEIKGTITSKVSSITSDVDQNLFAQVPEDKQEGVKKAELDLKISEENVKLAELKKELASTQGKYAGYEQDQAEKYRQEAAIALDIAKTEAIDESGLGKKDDNIKGIADLKSKKLRMEADRVNVEAKLATTKLRISNLTEQIKAQEEKIKDMESPKEKTEEKPAATTADEKEQQK
ncbi:MAG: hypothetical protein Q7J27_14210 [Syntrophales bacterium]|nr:hypothetical protein [Syntrophales bacterium]